MYILKNDLGNPNFALLKADHTGKNTKFRINRPVVMYFFFF